MTMLISQIVAMAANRVIGANGQIPWDLPEDLQRFKRITMGHTLLMGRKTYESIGRALPGRKTIVVSRQADYHLADAEVVSSVANGILLAESWGESELFICGGGEIYTETLPQAQRIYLTELQFEVSGQVYYPILPPESFEKILSRCYSGLIDYRFAIWQRLECKGALGAELFEKIAPEN